MTAAVMTSSRRPRATPAISRSATRPAQATSAPKLRYIVVTLVGIFAILGGQLLLSISVSSGAYEISSLKSEMRSSQQSLQIVGEEIGALNAPDTLASLAASMGMVEDNNPAYLRVSDGIVLGEALPADPSEQAGIVGVTAGTEAPVMSPIITDVSAALSAQAVVEMSAEDALAQALSVEAEAQEGSIQTAMVVTTTAPTTFGGSIPSPSTR
jgi:hypothetical protein